VEERIKNLLEGVPAVCVTTDGWTDVELRKYVVTTAHWLDDKFEQHHATIDLGEVQGSATAEALFAFIKSVIDKKLPKDTFVLVSVSDGAGNAIGASRYLAGDGALWCGAHLLQLVARTILEREPYASMIKQIRSYVGFVRSSTERRAALRKCQESVWGSLTDEQLSKPSSSLAGGNFLLQQACRALGLSVDEYEQGLAVFGGGGNDGGGDSVVSSSVEASSSSSSSSRPVRRRPVALQLKRDGVTRWNSTLGMLTRFGTLLPFLVAIQQESCFKDASTVSATAALDRGLLDRNLTADELLEALEQTISREDSPRALFERLCTPQVAKRIISLRRLLEPIAQVTVRAQANRYATLPHFAHWIHLIQSAWTRIANGDLIMDETRDAAKFLLSKLNDRDRFGDLFTSPSLPLRAAALSPFYGHLDFVPDERVRDAVWDSLFRDAVVLIPAPDASTHDSQSDSAWCTDDDSDYSSNDDDDCISTSSSSSSSAKAEHEQRMKMALQALRRQFEMPKFRRRMQRNNRKQTTAQFWRENIDKPFETKDNPISLKVLKPLILGYCGASGTSCSSESSLSVAGAVKSRHRARLSSSHLRMETLVARNQHLFTSKQDLICDLLLSSD
jgi:hypothetical protein